MQLQQQGRTTTGAVNAPKIDTSGQQAAAQTVQGLASGTLPLLERLNQFSGKALQLGTQKMVQGAKEQAVVDVENGDFSLSDDSTVYGMAYDGAAKTAYISNTTTDIKTTVSRIAAKNKYSPEGFKKDWDAQTAEYQKSSNEVDRNGYINAVVGDVAKQYGDAAAAKIAGDLVTAQRNIQIKENEESLVLLEDEYISAVVSGNDDAKGAALSSMRSTLSSMLQTTQIGQKGIEAKWKLLNKRVLKATVKNEFASKMASGEGTDYITNFRENAKKSENFKNITPTEMDEMLDGMYSTLSKKHGFEDEQITRVEAEKDRQSVQLKEDLNEAWLTSTLTVEDVDAALKSDLISPAEHKAYSLKVFDKGSRFTDTAKELMIVKNIATLSVDEIMNVENVTNEDKMKYIKQLRTYQKSDEGKWTSTVQGKASLQMLRNKFNISQASMLSKLTKQSDLAAYDKVYQNFILEMEQLSPEQRENRAMPYAQAAIDSQEASMIENGADASSGLTPQEQVLWDMNKKENISRLRERVDRYQKVNPHKSAAYLLGLAEFSDNFGRTGDIKFTSDGDK